MSKRDFLKKGASLIGGATLLGSAFAQSGNVNADVYKDMLDASWKYTFAKILAFFWLTSWQKNIEKEMKEKAFKQLNKELSSVILGNFDMFYSSDKEQRNLKQNFSFGGKDGFFIEFQGLGKSYTYSLYSKGSGDNNGAELLSVNVSVDNLSKAQEFYDTIDYMVTASKLETLCRNRPGLFQKNSYKGTGHVLNNAVDLSVNGKKVKEIYTPFNVEKTKEGFLGEMFIFFEDGTSLSFGKESKNPSPLPEMTKCMKEIIEQVEKIKAPVGKVKDKAGSKYLNLGDDEYGDSPEERALWEKL